jgi:hypothetical protein
MNRTRKMALAAGVLALAMSNSAWVMAQTSDSGTAASGTMGMHKKGMGGTTLHKQDKASHLKGASAAAAASALGTNDKGQPQ